MEYSGSNRYELLFMDDDAGLPAAPVELPVKKKQAHNTAAITAAAASAAGTANKKTASASKKSSLNSEKENKSNALNKNNDNKKSSNVSSKGNKTSGGASVAMTNNTNKSRSGIGETGADNRRVAFKTTNNDSGRDQQQQQQQQQQRNNNSRRNARETANTNDYSNEQQREQRQFRDRDNRGGGGGGGSGGGGGGSSRNREGGFRKREFDRQSGSDKTGVKAIDKRDGAGAHNWGSVKQEIDDVNKANADVEATLTDKDESSNEQSPEQPAVIEQEEETKEMTLDEWKAMRGERSKPQYNIRKPNEGEDISEWKKMIVLNKNKKKGSDSSEEELEYDPSMYPQRVGRLQRIVDIQFNFNDGRRGGFGRGGRGRGPRPYGGGGGGGGGSGSGGGGGGGGGGVSGNRIGGSGTGGDRPPRGGGGGDFGGGTRSRNFGDRQGKRGSNNANLKVDDERQFPTLS